MARSNPLGGGRHPCPECEGRPYLATPEQKGAIHLDCPTCLEGSVFRDGRGGYECSACDQRFLIHQSHPNDHYGGPEHVGGPIRWWERPLPWWGVLGLLGGFCFVLWLLPAPWWPALLLPYWIVKEWPPRRR